MASNDIRDIMDVGAPSADARPAKKQKVSAQQLKDQYAGMSKEVRGLMMGDGVPPVQVQEVRYKTKPKIARRIRPWVREPFSNPARTDGLVLSHWVRKEGRPDTPSGTGAPVTPAESKTENDGDTTKGSPSVYAFAKYNTKPSVPEYSDEEYAKHLQSENWSKEETDYLVQLALDFDLRWIVIADRYDFHPKESDGGGDAMAVTVAAKSRTMEDMKARYYEVAAKVMTVHHPLSSMSTAQFDLHEKMIKFDPVREQTRKRLAEALQGRSPDEVREEEVLMAELKRIVDNEERFLEERRELYNRLDHPQSTGSIAIYESSGGLIQLMQNLLASDKNKKRRSIVGPESNASPAQGGPAQTPTSAHGNNRGSISGPSHKKGSASTGVQAQKLSPRDEIRFGVSHHERLTSGVSFRQGRIEKLVLAKSAAQQLKLHDAMGQLGVPIKAVMPTTKVVAEYEKLVQSVHNLLDARKVSEKTSNEIRVLTTSKEMRERRERGEEEPAEGEGAHNADGDAKLEEDGEDKAQGEAQADAKDASDNEDENEGDEDGDQDQDEDVENDDEDDDEGPEADGEDDEAQEVEAEEEEEEAEAEVDGEDDDDEQDGEDPQEEEDADENDVEELEEEEAPSVKATSTHKRSASVLSMGSEKSSKKSRR